ncbi:sigma-70 family RNA polymerase sigma factor [Cypionkella aquatica]|uniref:sigma-70 family RNA polymerase sigma factor n=1 Tax=Cypionkella aquatica TaxID=1756042 RepID=UPI0024E176AB|nr:sigma-70 family RNA polymerase sigma factor [Cypionkella aquatica]
MTEDALATLLLAANVDDRQAYAQFLRAVTPIIRGIVRARSRSLAPDQHEDIVQDVLLAIHRKRQTWDPGQPVRPWLYAITRYKIIDAYRKRGVAVHLPIEDYADVLAAEQAADPLAARDDRAEVDHLLGQLDPRSAEVVRALVLRDEAQADVSARLQISPGNLRVMLHRSMKRMAQLGRRGEP